MYNVCAIYLCLHVYMDVCKYGSVYVYTMLGVKQHRAWMAVGMERSQAEHPPRTVS